MSKFKVGDKLRCKPGFTTRDDGEDRGGSGYKEGKEIIVGITTDWDEVIYWQDNYQGGGIYERALELAETNNEIVLW